MKTTIEITEKTSYKESQQYLVDKINKLITDDVIEIITNGNIACVMQDAMGYDLSTFEIKLESEDGTKKYPLGKFSGKPLFIDPYMRWDDNRILFKIDEDNINELEIIDENMILI